MIYRYVKYLLCISACGSMFLTTLTTSAYAVEVGGQITGSLTDCTIDSQPIEDGVVEGEWSWNTDTGEAEIAGTFSSVGISGVYTGAFDPNTQNIIVTWPPPVGSDANEFQFVLSPAPSGDFLFFEGDISGLAPSAAGLVDFTAHAKFELRGSDESWTEVSGTMGGKWSGDFNDATTPLSSPTWTGHSKSNECCDWEANWTAHISQTGMIVGNFDGQFNGEVVMDVSDPLGYEIGSPCGGSYSGTINLNSNGQVVFTGGWVELNLTGGTTGQGPTTGQQGYGGGIQLFLGSGTTSGFPFPITGTLSGGGTFTEPFGGSEVVYEMNGIYNGLVNLP